jgi:hypothetical protein
MRTKNYILYRGYIFLSFKNEHLSGVRAAVYHRSTHVLIIPIIRPLRVEIRHWAKEYRCGSGGPRSTSQPARTILDRTISTRDITTRKRWNTRQGQED